MVGGGNWLKCGFRVLGWLESLRGGLGSLFNGEGSRESQRGVYILHFHIRIGRWAGGCGVSGACNHRTKQNESTKIQEKWTLTVWSVLGMII